MGKLEIGAAAEECDELRQAIPENNRARLEDEAGDLLFAAVNVARFLNLDTS